MKKILTLTAMLFFINATFAQLYVSSDSFIYAKNQVVFVNQDIDLQSNANFYLRNEAQLLQGTTGTSANKGLGNLSVFQEGTVDNFEFNYWCSPVGNTSLGAGNENFGITQLNRPTGVSTSSPAIMLSNSATDGIAAPLSIAPRWIYKFLSSSTYSQWISVNSTTTIAAGQGFTMKGTSGTDATDVGETATNNPGSAQRYDFRGKPNDGNINVNVGDTKFTLTGNPYPSAMHVNAFLLDASNAAITGIAYYWEQDKTVNTHYIAGYKGGYGTFSPISLVSDGVYVPATFDTYNGDGSLNTTGSSSGLIIKRKYAPIGQGFMVKGAADGTVMLKNEHRAYYKETDLLSQFERPNFVVGNNLNIDSNPTAMAVESEPVSHIRLNAILNNQYTRQIALAFVPESTDGFDIGMDAISSVSEDLPADVYFFMDTNKYVIEAIPFEVNKRVKLGIRSDNSTFQFHIVDAVAFDPNQEVYIYDNADDSYHNVKSGNYEISLPTGVYNDRFELTFTTSALSVPAVTNDSFDVLQNNVNQQLTIANPNLIDIKSFSLYDITGKLILGSTRLGSEEKYQFSTSGISEGVYIVKLVTQENQYFSQKIAVFNKK